jgi:hypothetical protein
MSFQQKKFSLVNTVGSSMQTELNEHGREGWRYVKMEPFFQQKAMTGSHAASKFLVCIENTPDTISFHRVILMGKANKSHFSTGELNEKNKVMQNCGFNMIDFHPVLALHLNPEHNSRRMMKGYVCVWGISIDIECWVKMCQRKRLVTEIISQEHVKLDPATMDVYQYYYDLVERINELDNIELKKQMGEDWDEGLLDCVPDIDSVVHSLPVESGIEAIVEQAYWSSMGNLLVNNI